MKRVLFGFLLTLALCVDLQARSSPVGIEIQPLTVSGEIGWKLPFTGPDITQYHTVTVAPIVVSEPISIGAAYNTKLVPTSTAHEAVVSLVFGTVTGTYTTCTMQLETSLDGVNFLTLGSAQTVTVTSNHVNQWSIIEQIGTTSVTSGAVSATVALSFGQQSYFAFACSGGYGGAAPATLTVTYK